MKKLSADAETILIKLNDPVIKGVPEKYITLLKNEVNYFRAGIEGNAYGLCQIYSERNENAFCFYHDVFFVGPKKYAFKFFNKLGDKVNDKVIAKSAKYYRHRGNPPFCPVMYVATVEGDVYMIPFQLDFSKADLERYIERINNIEEVAEQIHKKYEKDNEKSDKQTDYTNKISRDDEENDEIDL